MSKLYGNVYTLDEENSHRFYKMPKELFLNDKYKHLNSDAKVLYSILLDRKELSRKNRWVDENRQVYLIYTRENLAEMMGISRPTVTKAFKQLVQANLIIEERMGLNKPNRIYICRLEYSSTNGRKDSLHQEVTDVSSSDTEYSETEKIKRYAITSNSEPVFQYYNFKYKERFNKDHPTVTEAQLKELSNHLVMVSVDLDISEDSMMDCIDDHFENLSDKNDGKMFSFLSPDGEYGVLKRLYGY